MARLRRHIALFLFVTVTVSAPGQSGTTDLDSIRRLLPTLTDHELFKAHFILAQATEGTYPLEAAEHAKKALVIATRLGKRDTVPTLYATLSFTAAQLGNFKEALSNGYTSLDLATALGNKRNIASAHSTLGITYGYLGQYSKALEHHEEAFRIREEIGWYYGASRTLNNIGIVYHNMGQYDKAIEYYNEVQKRRGFETDTLSLIRYHQNVGFAELRRGNLDTAIALQRIALDMSERFHFTNGKAYSLYNLGLIEIEKKEYPKAVIDLLRSLAHYHQLGQKHGSVQVLNALGIAAHGAKDDVNAIRYLHEAASLASSIGAADELKKAYETLTMLYDRRGETATAYRYYKLFTAAKDSVFNSKESNRITDLLLRIERQKKERELELLRAESVHALHEQELRGYALIGDRKSVV